MDIKQGVCLQVGIRQVIAGWDQGIIGSDDIPPMKVRNLLPSLDVDFIALAVMPIQILATQISHHHCLVSSQKLLERSLDGSCCCAPGMITAAGSRYQFQKVAVTMTRDALAGGRQETAHHTTRAWVWTTWCWGRDSTKCYAQI